MSTANDLIIKARRRLNDFTDESFEDAPLIDWTNQGAKEFTSRAAVLQSADTINTDGSNSTFNVSNLTNFVNAFSVQYAGIQLGFTPRPQIIIAWGTSVGTPVTWSIWGELLYFDVIPTLATGSDAITVFYSRTPTEMSTSDTSAAFDFPQEWEFAIVAYMTYRALDSIREGSLASRQRAEFDAALASAAEVTAAKTLGGGFSG